MEKRDTKQANKYTWNQYLSHCERLCPESLSFSVLLMGIPFYQAYQNGISHRRLMCEIEHVAGLDFMTADQRLAQIKSLIDGTY